MSYTKAKEPHAICITLPLNIAATTTIRGPLMKTAGEVVGADYSSAGNHVADASTSSFVIDVRANGNTAWSMNSAVTQANASTVTFPTQNATVANRRFASGEELTIVCTKGAGTPVNLGVPLVNTSPDFFWIYWVPVYDVATA